MATRPAETESGWMAGALLLAAVATIVAAGAVLSTEPPREGSAPAPAAVSELPPAPAPAPLETVPEAEPASVKARADRDLGRLGSSPGSYTAQLLVACKAETVERLVAAAGAAEDLYVLPAEVRGQSCFRLCWGSYGTAEQAALAADLPGALRSAERPRAVPIASVLP